MERRTKRLLAEDTARQADVEAACWSLRPIMGHYTCTMMVMIMIYS